MHTWPGFLSSGSSLACAKRLPITHREALANAEALQICPGSPPLFTSSLLKVCEVVKAYLGFCAERFHKTSLTNVFAFLDQSSSTALRCDEAIVLEARSLKAPRLVDGIARILALADRKEIFFARA
ncbi:hypothetical protein NDN08_004453 [Rhodosorus marinus]|uniref:Uncharacterized protein n=1 Tax=Rhodosorus marinus TaxID=101924 RepID=A0AAV8ULB8_9RHOD|nr:hypothetical protein NDN08_004453 [Rhodosorus marinus]